jgi:hypothetical protein
MSSLSQIDCLDLLQHISNLLKTFRKNVKVYVPCVWSMGMTGEHSSACGEGGDATTLALVRENGHIGKVGAFVATHGRKC